MKTHHKLPYVLVHLKILFELLMFFLICAHLTYTAYYKQMTYYKVLCKSYVITATVT